MLDKEEIDWVKSTANELNNLLQVISESSQVLERLCGTADGENYFGILRNGVERATKVTRAMMDRVGGYSAEPAATAFSVVLPLEVPKATAPVISSDVQIHNPTGARELVMIVDD